MRCALHIITSVVLQNVLMVAMGNKTLLPIASSLLERSAGTKMPPFHARCIEGANSVVLQNVLTFKRWPKTLGQRIADCYGVPDAMLMTLPAAASPDGRNAHQRAPSACFTTCR